MASAASPRRALVTGASGFVGGAVVRALRAHGWRVRVLARTTEREEPGVESVHGELPHDLPDGLLDDVDAVIHCAALTTPGSDELARSVNVDGTLALARHAAGARFVFVSTQSARPDAPSAYGRTKAEAETALLSMPTLDAVIVRPGLVVGPGSRGLFARMRSTARRLPVLPLLDGGRALVQAIHVEDLAEALVRCAEGAVPRGSVLHLGDPRPVTLREILERLSVAECGRRKPVVSVPVAALLPFVRLAEALRLALPVTSGSLRALRSVERMETEADLARLGLTLRPLDEALRT